MAVDVMDEDYSSLMFYVPGCILDWVGGAITTSHHKYVDACLIQNNLQLEGGEEVASSVVSR